MKVSNLENSCTIPIDSSRKLYDNAPMTTTDNLIGKRVKFSHTHSTGEIVTFGACIIGTAKDKAGSPALKVAIPEKVQRLKFAPFAGAATTWVRLSKVESAIY